MVQHNQNAEMPAHIMPHHPPTTRIPQFIIKAVSIASLGGILFGYDMGVVSGALPQLKASLDLTQSQQEMVVSFLYLGGGIGAAVGGSLCDSLGRKSGILITDVIFIIGAVLLYFSWNLPSVLVGRIIVGFGVSVSGVADVAYLHEISPSEWRGSIVSVNEACISLGFLLAYIAGFVMGSIDPNEGWRTLFGLSAPIAVVQFIGMIAMPESPVWLEDQGRYHEAEAALKVIYRGSGVCGNTSEIEDDDSYEMPLSRPGSPSSVKKRQKISEGSVTPDSSMHSGSSMNLPEKMQAPCATSPAQRHQSSGTSAPFMVSQSSSLESQYSPPSSILSSCWRTVKQNALQFQHEVEIHRQQATIAVFLSMVQQFCGHPNVLNYAPEIFQQVGLASPQSSLGATLLIGVIKFIVTCVVIWKIEFLGRRFLLLSGMSTIAVSLALLSVCFFGTDERQMSSGWGYAATVGVFGVALGYAASFGPLTWLLTSEMFPTSVRGRALGASTIVTYLSASLVSYTFLSGQKVFGPCVPFVIYSIITSTSVVFAYLAIPDTGDRSPEEIEGDIQDMWWWKQPWGGRRSDQTDDWVGKNSNNAVLTTYASMGNSPLAPQGERKAIA